jgi:hypothetical protein
MKNYTKVINTAIEKCIQRFRSGSVNFDLTELLFYDKKKSAYFRYTVAKLTLEKHKVLLNPIFSLISLNFSSTFSKVWQINTHIKSSKSGEGLDRDL